MLQRLPILTKKNVRSGNVKEDKLKEEVKKRKDKYILVLNDQIIDGYHHLAKAYVGKLTSSLPILDLSPLRFQ